MNWASGAALLLSGLLLIAGVLKLADPRPTADALRRLTGPAAWRYPRPTPIAAARGLGGVEAVLAAGLLFTSGSLRVVVTILTAASFVGFAGVVVLAIRRGLACGCFGSFSDGPAGGAEAGRALTLALIAVGLALTTPETFSFTLSTVAAAAVFGAATIAAMLIGRMIRPTTRPQSAGRGAAIRTFVGGVSSNRAAFPLPRPTERRTLTAAEIAPRASALDEEPVVRSVVAELEAAGATPSWAQARGTQFYVRSRQGTRVVSEQFVVPCEPGGQLDVTFLPERRACVAYGRTPTGDRIPVR